MIGDTRVGKTTITTTYKSGEFCETNRSTIGAVYSVYRQTFDKTVITLHVYDTAGQEKYRNLVPMYYRGAHAAVLVFDLTSRDTFQSLEFWINAFLQIEPNSKIIIAANKIDLQEEIEVSIEEATEYSLQRGIPLYFTSAKTGDGIKELFDAVFKYFFQNQNLRNSITEGSQKVSMEAAGGGCC